MSPGEESTTSLGTVPVLCHSPCKEVTKSLLNNSSFEANVSSEEFAVLALEALRQVGCGQCLCPALSAGASQCPEEQG